MNPISAGYGGEYFSINTPVTISNPNDTALQLTLTVNGDPSGYVWFSPGQLVINDSSGIYYYGEPYNGYGNGGNPRTRYGMVTRSPVRYLSKPWRNSPFRMEALRSTASTLTWIWSVISTGTGNFDVTYNSAAFIPEPASVSLVGVGLGLLGLFGLRRRHTS